MKAPSLLPALLVTACASTTASSQVVFRDDFERYDVENPSLLSVGGVPGGDWTPSSGATNASRVFDTGNFGGTRLWISLVDGTSLVSRAIAIESARDYRFSAVLVSETFSGARRLDASYDVLVGLDPADARSVIGGPRAVVTNGDDWLIDNSKEDHIFTQDFSVGALAPGEALFVCVTRIGVNAGQGAWFGLDDVEVLQRRRIEVLETGFTSEVDEQGRTDTLEVHVRGRPAGPVRIRVRTDDQLRVDGEQELTLVFTPPVDPDTPRVLTVSAVDDGLEEGLHTGRVSFEVLDSPGDLPALPSLDVSIGDDDWPVLFAADVFSGGQDGYPVYRIPGMTAAADGTLLAFVEARLSSADPGKAGEPIDLVQKVSRDGGETWSPLVVLADDDAFDFSDPAPIQTPPGLAGDAPLVLHYIRWPDDAGLFGVPPGTGPESSNHFVRFSTDAGTSWSAPLNITAQIKLPSWRGVVAGPGNGIRLRWQTDPARNGHLVVPAHRHGTANFVVSSTDGGATWSSGGLAQPMTGTPAANENEVVELTNGDLLMNARPNSGNRRRLFRSEDGGATWIETWTSSFLITTVDGSLVRYSARRDGGDRDRLLFSGPLGEPLGSGAGRLNMAVRTSYDEGRSFINPVQLDVGDAAYSVLAPLRDGSVGLLFESTASRDVSFLRFRPEDLENGPHAPALACYEGFGNRVDRAQGGVGWSGFWTPGAHFTGDPFPGRARGADVPFQGLPFPPHGGRVELDRGQATERMLATPIDTDVDQTCYLSLLVHRDASDAGDLDGLRVELGDASGTALAAFGVDALERFAIDAPGSPTTSAAGLFEPATSYLLLVELELRGGASPETFDRLSLAAFASAIDRLPTHPDRIDWTVRGATDANVTGLIDRVTLSGEAGACWHLDELRLSTSVSSRRTAFRAVADSSHEPARPAPSGASVRRR